MSDVVSDRCRMDRVRIVSNVQMFAQSNNRLSKSNMSNAERLPTGKHPRSSSCSRDEPFSLALQGEQLTIKTGTCCPTCSKVRRSCLYDGTAILVGLRRLALVCIVFFRSTTRYSIPSHAFSAVAATGNCFAMIYAGSPSYKVRIRRLPSWLLYILA